MLYGNTEITAGVHNTSIALLFYVSGDLEVQNRSMNDSATSAIGSLR